MRLRRRRAAALALALCTLPAGVTHAQGDASGQYEPSPRKQDNIAVATTEQDGARAFDFAWALRRQRGGVVDHRNVANAAARCTDCRATSIAFQIVLVSGQPEQLTPRNQAVAINDQCTRCVVYAGARQFVRVVDGDVRFTREGLATLADVRRQLRALEGQDLDALALAAKVEEQEARVVKVLTEQLVVRDAREPDGERRAHVRDRADRQADDS